ncbi:MAG: hypothetical protein DCC64_01925 [Planctomycetota bacterium]|nr:MAG: hypothetical protein DCC64_01925 [Planctomycetota bacterium]
MVESETTRLNSEEHTETPGAPGQPRPKKKKKGVLLRALREQNELLRAQLQQQGAQIEALTSSVAALAAREPAAPVPTKTEEDAEALALIRDARREINSRVLAAIRGEDPVAAKAVENSLAQVRKLLKDVGEVKQLAQEASATLGGDVPAAPEMDLAESIEKFAGAAERISQTHVGRKVLMKLGLSDADTPALDDKTTTDVSATYG